MLDPALLEPSLVRAYLKLGSDVEPELHRNPGPRRVDHLHHHTPVTLSKSPQPPTNTRSPTLNSEEPDKYSDVWRSYVNDEMTPAEFRDWYNTAGNYRVEF